MIYRTDLLSASHSTGKIVLATTTRKKKNTSKSSTAVHPDLGLSGSFVCVPPLEYYNCTEIGRRGENRYPNYFLCTGAIRETLIMRLLIERII